MLTVLEISQNLDGKMKQSKTMRAENGYTIVEVMIFLVITAVLLVSGLSVFRGQQQKAQFTQGVREFETQLRTVVNEVSTGYYPKNAGYTCTVTPSGPTPALGTGEQGTNTPCIFLGKVIKFAKGTNQSAYSAFTVAGRRVTSTGDEVSTYDSDTPATAAKSALPTLIAPVAAGGLFDSEQKFELPWGITFTAVRNVDNNTGVGAVGFLMSLGSYDSSTDLVSGSQVVDAYPLIGTSFSSDTSDLKAKTRALKDSHRNHGALVVCLKSGGGDRRAAVVIGGSSRQLSMETFIDNIPNSYGCPAL